MLVCLCEKGENQSEDFFLEKGWIWGGWDYCQILNDFADVELFKMARNWFLIWRHFQYIKLTILLIMKFLNRLTSNNNRNIPRFFMMMMMMMIMVMMMNNFWFNCAGKFHFINYIQLISIIFENRRSHKYCIKTRATIFFYIFRKLTAHRFH